jgi:arsenate reductase (thioredoxin)
MSSGTPEVLFVCVRNAGRSQMAAALLERRGRGLVRVRSAGSEPADDVHHNVRHVMDEIGIDLAGARPKRLDDDAVLAADLVVTMGCGDACPFLPGKRYEDWAVDDPAGKSLEETRRIRDEIDARVLELLRRLR